MKKLAKIIAVMVAVVFGFTTLACHVGYHKVYANDDSASTAQNTPVIINVLSNDSSEGGHSFWIIGYSQGSKGTVAQSGSALVYTPAPGTSGVDTFTYTIQNDVCGSTDSGTVTVTVTACNRAPDAVQDSSSVNQGGSVTINVLSNDSDPDGDPISIINISSPAHGTAVGGPDGIVYTHNGDSATSDSFTYTISDGKGGTDTTTVTITINRVNNPPVANNDSDSTRLGVPVTVNVLGNDSDPDGDSISIISVGSPSRGTAAVSGSSIVYTPGSGYYTSDSFVYTISDGKGGTATATVTITINVCNRAPDAVHDYKTTDRTTAVTVDVLDNDTDPDGDPLTITHVGTPSHGTAVETAGGILYTPNGDYVTSDSFEYSISDGKGGTDTTTVSITITCENRPPVANDDSGSTTPSEPLTINILANDSDPDGDTIAITDVGSPSHGTAVKSGTSIVYTPGSGYFTSDSFTYAISDGKGGTDTATVTITITGANRPPVADDDTGSTDPGTPVTVNVLGNDSDPDGDTISIISVGSPSHGTAVKSGASIVYTPGSGSFSSDSFTYTISDGKGGTDTATVTITLNNSPPVARNDSDTTEPGVKVSVSVLANDTDADGDELTITSVGIPSHGTAVINGKKIDYTPGAGSFTYDSFTYAISDGNGGTDTAIVTITLNNRPPIAKDDADTTRPGVAVYVPVLGNDSDPDGDVITITSASAPTHGSASVSGLTVIYTPAADFYGTDSFTYTISDGRGGTDTATVTINVVNTPPVAKDDGDTARYGIPVTVSVLNNDEDVDGDTLTITTVGSPAHGTAVKSGTSIIYTPSIGKFTSDTFTYSISDGHGGTASATVTISMNNVAPIARNDSSSTQQGTPVTISVLSNDSDPDGDTMSIVSVSGLVNGSANIYADGITYTPNSGFYGVDQFTYTIKDGFDHTASAVVTVTVNGTPDAMPDEAKTQTGKPVTITVLTNDTDPDGDTLTITGNTQGAHGTVSMSGTSFVYTPASNFYGTDTFTYTIADGKGGTDSTIVTIIVNAPPVAANDTKLVTMNTPATISVLANDSDPDGDTITITTVGTPSHGTAAKSGDSIVYTPNSGYRGPDDFTYTISDGNGGTAAAHVIITVNAPPEAVNDITATMPNTPISIFVLNNDSDADGDALTITAVTAPSHGTAVISGDKIVYTPATNYLGTDTFTYTIKDTTGATDTATVTVTVHRNNNPPVAVNDSISTYQNVGVTVTVIINDYDPNGDALTVISATAPSHGTVSITGNYIFYMPTGGFLGTDTFTYTVSDGFGGTATALVQVTVGTNIIYVPTTTSPTYVYSGTAGYTANAPQEIGDTQGSTSVPKTGNVPLNPILLVVFFLGGLAALLLYLKRKHE